jgi:chromosome segregation ATPase
MTTPAPTPKPRGRKPTGTALSNAERQRRYRERQKAKLAAAEIPLRDDKAEDRIAELNAENDALAVKADRLTRELKARDNENARLRKRLDELVADLAFLRSRVATWKAEEGTVSANEPVRVKGKRKKA